MTRVWQSEKEKELQSTKQDTLQRYHDNLKREFEQQRLDYQNQPSAEHKLALENTQSLLVNIERQINALKRLSGDERACSPPLSLINRVSCPIPHSNNAAALSILRSTSVNTSHVTLLSCVFR